MTPEALIKKQVDKILKAHAPHIWYFKPVSAGYGKHGIPDYIVVVNGQFVAIECKGKSKSDLTVLQRLTFSAIEDAGGYTFLANSDTVGDLDLFVRKILNE